jgi:hypothetical protein
MAKDSGILETIGTIFGLVTGGPVGAAKGAFVGNLLGGGNFQDAFTSGIGSLFQTNPTLGMASQAFNFGGGGGGGSSNNVFANAINTATGGGKTPQGGIPNLLSSIGIGQPTAMPTNLGTIFGSMIAPESGSTDNPLTALMAAMALQAMNRKTNPFTALEERQYQTGERNPDYRGTPVPDYRYMNSGRPTGIRAAAAGGMIDGPGSGKSDSIPAQIYQGGSPVQEARLSDGEFVMTADAVKGAGGGNRAQGAAKMYRMMNQFEGRA